MLPGKCPHKYHLSQNRLWIIRDPSSDGEFCVLENHGLDSQIFHILPCFYDNDSVFSMCSWLIMHCLPRLGVTKTKSIRKVEIMLTSQL